MTNTHSTSSEPTRRALPWARALCASTLIACLSGMPAAFAQDGAQPREIPEGFVVPGPAPTNAPEAGGGTGAAAPSGQDAPASSPATPEAADAATRAPVSQGGSLPAAPSTVVGEGRTAANPMAFANMPETGTTNWPCVQRQVETIQAAQIWSGPDLEIGRSVERTAQMRAIVDQAVARRIDGEAATRLVRDYVETVPEDEREAVSTALFTDILDRLNLERNQVMGGIMRYGSRQKALADALREKAREMARIRREGDATAFADIREEMAWDTRIFDDRRKSLTYVCEVPILIERRAFALGRELSRGL
ncbi:hypothetical protein [Fulvimarina sp. 2208YS6-2-32]|nr:hypothetical protein [Fulvimarina sp. 2208YS6-2-32]